MSQPEHPPITDYDAAAGTATQALALIDEDHDFGVARDEERRTCRECGQSIPVHAPSGVILRHGGPGDPLGNCEGGWKLPVEGDVRTDGVHVKTDGRGKWVVVRGGDCLGVMFDEGPEMKRGRFAGWSPHAGTPGNTTAFSDDPAKVVDSIVQAWPVTAAEVVTQTGAPLDAVLATAEQVTKEWQATGRCAVLRIAAAKGAATKMTREAAAEVTARLTGPVPPLALNLAPGHCVNGEHGAGKDEAEQTTAELPGPEWGTLKGFKAPFRLWGEERERGRFAPCYDRKQVTGEPLVIVEVWTTQRGTARHGRDANGREIHLHGAATRFWRAPGA